MAEFIIVHERRRFERKVVVTFDLNPLVVFFKNDEDRKGPWESLATDRCRFHRRIIKVSNEIEWCLKPSHRKKIFDKLNF
jgi:hypothetical protein